jgi:cytochrome c oxidase subunit 2
MNQELQLLPHAATEVARSVDRLTLFLTAMSLFFVALISSLVLFFAARYRARRALQAAVQIEGSIPLELAWTAVPLLLALFSFAWGAKLYFDMNASPAGALALSVTGKRWMWKVQHPEGPREINELHVPVGVPIELTMISEDVIHSFYIPAFRLKRDVLPGRFSKLTFTADRVGEYHLFCAEYCGTKHSQMIGRVVVMQDSDYQAWLSGAPRGATPAQSGAQLFGALRCDTCHAPQSGARGPDLAGLFGTKVALADGRSVVADEDYVRESILNPAAKLVAGYAPLMPTYAGQVSEVQIQQLIAYIRSTAWAPSAAIPQKP